MHVSLSICMYIHAYTNDDVHTRARTHTQTHTHKREFVCVCVPVCIDKLRSPWRVVQEVAAVTTPRDEHAGGGGGVCSYPGSLPSIQGREPPPGVVREGEGGGKGGWRDGEGTVFEDGEYSGEGGGEIKGTWARGEITGTGVTGVLPHSHTGILPHPHLPHPHQSVSKSLIFYNNDNNSVIRITIIVMMMMMIIIIIIRTTKK